MRTTIFIAALSLFINGIIFTQPLRSEITPHLNRKHIQGINLIYTSSFGAAWQELGNSILNERVKTAVELDLVEQLNAASFVKPDNSKFFQSAGFVEDGIVKKIEAGIQKKFNKQIELTEFTNDPFSIICYSYFEADIKFNTPFESFSEKFPFWGTDCAADIDYFGIRQLGNSDYHNSLRQQVKVYSFINKGEFAVSLSNINEEDEIIAAVLKPEKTLGLTIQKTLEQLELTKADMLAVNDRLLIPKISFRFLKRYDQLLGIYLANERFKEYFFLKRFNQ